MEICGHDLSKCIDRYFTDLQSFTVKIKRKEQRDLIALQILLCAIEFFVIFEEIDAELEAAAFISFIDEVEDVVEELRVGYFDSKQNEYFDFIKEDQGELLFGNIHDELAEEVEVELGCNFFIYSLVYVVVLV